MSPAKQSDVREVLRRPLHAIGMDRGRAVSNADPSEPRQVRARQVLRAAIAEKHQESGPETLGAAGRFVARPKDSARHNPYVDAGWWPHSVDLDLELEQLLVAAHAVGFDASGVTYRLGDPWVAPPPDVVVGGRRIKLSGYHNHRAGMITLVDRDSHELLEVMVVPPDTDPTLAGHALQIAALNPDPKQGAEILAMAGKTASNAETR